MLKNTRMGQLAAPGNPSYFICLVNIHLHTAVSHRHGIIGQGVTGHLAVIGAADGGERAHMASTEWVSSLVWSGEVTTTGFRLILMQHCDTGSNRWVTFQFYLVRNWVSAFHALLRIENQDRLYLEALMALGVNEWMSVYVWMWPCLLPMTTGPCNLWMWTATLGPGNLLPSNTSSSALGKLWFSPYSFLNSLQFLFPCLSFTLTLSSAFISCCACILALVQEEEKRGEWPKEKEKKKKTV